MLPVWCCVVCVHVLCRFVCVCTSVYVVWVFEIALLPIAVLTGFGLNIFELFSAAFACVGSSFQMDEFFNLSQLPSNFRISRYLIKGTFFFKNGVF